MRYTQRKNGVPHRTHYLPQYVFSITRGSDVAISFFPMLTTYMQYLTDTKWNFHRFLQQQNNIAQLRSLNFMYSEGLIVCTAAVSFINQICILNCLRCILYRLGVKWKERLCRKNGVLMVPVRGFRL